MGITRKSILASATTDNGTNIVAVMRDLKWNRLSCFGHNLHLTITNSIKDDSRVTQAIDIAHRIIKHSHTAGKRNGI